MGDKVQSNSFINHKANKLTKKNDIKFANNKKKRSDYKGGVA